MDQPLETALLTLGGGLFAKVVYDLWERLHEKRSIAAAIAGELGAYLSLMKGDTIVASLRLVATLDRANRVGIMQGYPALPSSHPVFDNVADKIGLLSAEDALDISAIYNVVTGFRLLLTNMSSDKFLATEDAFQIKTLETLADGIEEHFPKAKLLVIQLTETSERGLMPSLYHAVCRGLGMPITASHSRGDRPMDEKMRRDLEFEEGKAAIKYGYDFRIESFKGTLEYARAAIQGLVLINGGAILAVLALFGNVWKKDDSIKAVASSMATPLKGFIVGLTMAVICAAISYVAQGNFSRFTREHDRLARPFQILAIVLSIGSVLAFLWSALRAAHVLKHGLV